MVVLSICLELAIASEPGLFFQDLAKEKKSAYIEQLQNERSSATSKERLSELECILKCLSGWKDSEGFLREAHRAHPNNSRIAGLYCWRLTMQENLEEAQSVLSRLEGRLPKHEYLILQAKVDASTRNLEILEDLAEVDQYARMTLAKIIYQKKDYVRAAQIIKPLTENGNAGPCLEAALPYKLHASALANCGDSSAVICNMWKRAFEIDPADPESARNLWLNLFRDETSSEESLRVAEKWWDALKTEEAALAVVRSTEKVLGPEKAIDRLAMFDLPSSLGTELMRAYLLVGAKRYQESRKIYTKLAIQEKNSTALLGFVTAAAYDRDASEADLAQAAEIARTFLRNGKVTTFEHAKICIFALLRVNSADEARKQTDSLFRNNVISESDATKLKALCQIEHHARTATAPISSKDRY